MLKWKSGKWLIKTRWLFRLLGKFYALCAALLGAVAIICGYFAIFPNEAVFAEMEMSHTTMTNAAITCAFISLVVYFVIRNIWYRLADLVEELASGEWTSKRMLRTLEVLPLLFLYNYVASVISWLWTVVYGGRLINYALEKDPGAVERLMRSGNGWVELVRPNFHGMTSLIMALLFYVLYKVLAERDQFSATVRAIEEEHKLVI